MAKSPAIVALVGLRGAGKSTVGRLLAEALECGFCDLDERLTRVEPGLGESAGEILARVGEARFRELEARALADCLASPAPLVLATGGGVVEGAANRRLLVASARCVWLEAEPHVLHARVTADGTERPALTDLDPLEEMRALAARRAPLYAEVAELRVLTADLEPRKVADEIFTRLHR